MNPPSESCIEEQVSFKSGPDTLEGILAYPDEGVPDEAVLLLSPHPHMGGRMDNNVIAHLARHLAGAGCATLRFNYGGVGGSTRALFPEDSPYEFWARLEAEQNYQAVLPDALAARACLAAAVPAARLGYVGYSFGSCLAVLLAGIHPPAWLAALAPPVARAPLTGLSVLTMPCCFVAGDRDFAFDAVQFQTLFEQVPGPKAFIELPGCDHFFRKREADVLSAILSLHSGSYGRDVP